MKKRARKFSSAFWLMQPLSFSPEGGDGGAGAGSGDGGSGDAGQSKDDGQQKGADGAQAGDGKSDAADSEMAQRIEAMQKVNRDLEAKINGLKDGFKQALGIDDKKTTPEELVGKLQQRLDELTHTTLVNTVARGHKITDEDDIATLSAIKDEAVMRKVAERLAPSDDAQDSSKSRKGTPRPDTSQGRSGGESGNKPVSVSQVMADRAAARDAAKK